MAEVRKVIVTPVGRLAFTKSLFSKDEESGKYSAALLIPEDKDMKALKQEAIGCAKKEFGDKWESANIALKSPTRDTIEDYPYLDGNLVLNGNSGFEIGIADRNKDPVFEDGIKAGDYARFAVSVYPWTYKKRFGVGFNIQGIQLIKEGEAFYTKRDVSDYFSSDDVSEDFGEDESGDEEYKF